jgi:hypothetical protein
MMCEGADCSRGGYGARIARRTFVLHDHRVTNLRDGAVVTAGIGAVAAAGVPFYRGVFAGEPVRLTDVFAPRVKATPLATPVVLVACLILAAIFVLGARVYERRGGEAVGARMLAFASTALATVAAVLDAVALPLRALTTTSCFGWVDSSNPAADCATVQLEWVPSTGYLLAAVAAFAASVAAFPAGRFRGPGGMARRAAGWSVAIVPVGAVGGLVVAVASVLPVYRHFAVSSSDGRRNPAVDWTAWHGVAAPSAVVILLVAAALVARSRPRRGAGVVAAGGLVAALIAGFAVPVGNDGSERFGQWFGVRTALAMTWMGWGWFLLLGGALLIAAAAAIGSARRVVDRRREPVLV